jgi:hypothetical protein
MPWLSGARSVVGMRHHLHITTIRSLMLAGVASSALAAPSLAVVPQDAGVASTPAGQAAIDLRSPDAQDAGQPVAFDLRSPDAAQPVVLPATRPTVASPHAAPSGDGFDVTSALIGAGIAALLAMGAVVLVRTRGRHSVAPLGG